MQRREFFKLLAASGLTMSLPLISSRSFAEASPDHFLVMVNASGGWDPTALCDPKGNTPRSDGRGPVNNFAAADIRKVGSMIYAPYPSTITMPATDQLDAFFAKHFSRLMVINGIDNQTNSHSVGNRFTWSGKSGMGNPSLAALVAASAAPTKPMTYISNGGYDYTDSLVSASRVSGNSNFAKLAFPNRPDATNASSTARYLDDSIYSLVEQARKDSLQRQIASSGLPKRRIRMRELLSARSGNNSLDEIVKRLPSSISGGFKGQAEMAAAAFASGLTIAANLNTGGFDTHGDHDNRQTSSINTLLDGVDHLWSELERQGVAARTTVLIGSDFGRTPFYNTGRGKDHWNVTSMMAMGAGIKGNTVIGGTTDLFTARKINPVTLAFDDAGVNITPAVIHKALRRLMGLSGTDLDKRYPVAADELPLFTS